MRRLAPELRERWIAIAIRWALILGATAVLELLTVCGIVSEFVVPRPSAVLLACYELVLKPHVLVYFAITLGEVLAVTAGLVLLGIPFGILLGRQELLWRAWGGWIAALAAAPIVLLYPLFLVVFGRSWLTVAVIALLTALPSVVLKTVEGIQSVRPTLIDVGRSFNIGKWHQFWKVILPAALPAILLGMRLGLIYTLITVVAIEYLISLGGLGRLVAEFAEKYELASTYATVLLVITVSIIFFIAIERAEKWLIRSA